MAHVTRWMVQWNKHEQCIDAELPLSTPTTPTTSQTVRAAAHPTGWIWSTWTFEPGSWWWNRTWMPSSRSGRRTATTTRTAVAADAAAEGPMQFVVRGAPCRLHPQPDEPSEWWRLFQLRSGPCHVWRLDDLNFYRYLREAFVEWAATVQPQPPDTFVRAFPLDAATGVVQRAGLLRLEQIVWQFLDFLQQSVFPTLYAVVLPTTEVTNATNVKEWIVVALMPWTQLPLQLAPVAPVTTATIGAPRSTTPPVPADAPWWSHVVSEPLPPEPVAPPDSEPLSEYVTIDLERNLLLATKLQTV